MSICKSSDSSRVIVVECYIAVEYSTSTRRREVLAVAGRHQLQRRGAGDAAARGTGRLGCGGRLLTAKRAVATNQASAAINGSGCLCLVLSRLRAKPELRFDRFLMNFRIFSLISSDDTSKYLIFGRFSEFSDETISIVSLAASRSVS